MVKPLPINNKIRGARRFAAPNSIYFRTWFAQQQRKDRKEANSRLLLDNYPGAAAAYSLRGLSIESRRQPVIRVRRSSDNTEQDFTAGQVTDGTLAGFCGTGDGLVTTWYDQSGNSNDATQTTAANQPKIVDAGVLVTENERPTLDFDGVDDFLQSAGLGVIANGNGGFSVFLTGAFQRIAGPSAAWSFEGLDGNNLHMLRLDDGVLEHQRIGDIVSRRDDFSSIIGNNQYLVFSAYNGTEKIGGLDGGTLVVDQDAQSLLSSEFLIGKGEGKESEMLAQELIVYPSDQSANREAIESNINAHYGIF
jgi:hypothetical protein